MQKQSFFPLFLGDLLTSCGEWPGEAVSLYTSLLAHQWFSPDHSIPVVPDSVRAVVRWDSSTFDRYWPIVSEKFQEVDVAGRTRLRNARCEYHRERTTEISETRSAAGRKGGLARAAKQQAVLDLFQANADGSEANASNLPKDPILSNPIQSDPSVSEVSSDTSSPPGRGRKPPPCPYEQITAVYAELLPNFPKLVTHPQWRKAAVQARWREDPRFQTLDFWMGYFRYVGESDFLSGRAKPFDDRKPFKADFDWITGSKNFHKILSGKYHHD